MRRLVLLSLLASLFCVSSVEARLFWQTYGSVIPGENGGCTWNWNQDYFVPRHSSTGRYDLFGPCKTSRTTSPACKWCHPYHDGYCGIYGPCHYRRRNHVYQAYCGCSPLCVTRPERAGCGRGCRVPYRQGCGPMCGGAGPMCPAMCASGLGYESPMPNVEAPGLEILGSISVEGDGLLASVDVTPLDEAEGQLPGLLGPQSLELQKLLPALGLPMQLDPGQALPTP